MKQELLAGLTEEQIKKANQCKSVDELLALAKHEGYELSEDQLAAVSGGFCSSDPEPINRNCPACGASVEGHFLYNKSLEGDIFEFECKECGKKWKSKK